MARLASISKAGFYPIPPALLPAVGAAVVLDWGTPEGSRSYQSTRHAVLDPCAGEGDAVFLLPDDFDDDTRIVEAVLRYHPPRAWTAC